VGINTPEGLDQTEGGSYVTDPGVGVSVWRAKAVRLGNACCFDSPVCGAKLSSCFNRAKGGQVWMGIGVVLYRVSLAVFSFDQTWIELRPSSDDKERGLDPVIAQNVQDPGRVGANWPVVEGEPDDAGCGLWGRPELLRLSCPPGTSTTATTPSTSAKLSVASNASGQRLCLLTLLLEGIGSTPVGTFMITISLRPREGVCIHYPHEPPNLRNFWHRPLFRRERP
jgi:hypothetical protein